MSLLDFILKRKYPLIFYDNILEINKAPDPSLIVWENIN